MIENIIYSTGHQSTIEGIDPVPLKLAEAEVGGAQEQVRDLVVEVRAEADHRRRLAALQPPLRVLPCTAQPQTYVKLNSIIASKYCGKCPYRHSNARCILGNI